MWKKAQLEQWIKDNARENRARNNNYQGEGFLQQQHMSTTQWVQAQWIQQQKVPVKLPSQSNQRFQPTDGDIAVLGISASKFAPPSVKKDVGATLIQSVLQRKRKEVKQQDQKSQLQQKQFAQQQQLEQQEQLEQQKKRLEQQQQQLEEQQQQLEKQQQQLQSFNVVYPSASNQSSSQELPPKVLVADMTIEISHGISANLKLYENDDPRTVVEEFAKRIKLEFSTSAKLALAKKLEELLLNHAAD